MRPRRRARQITREVDPLLAELYPSKSKKERLVVVDVFAAFHGRPLDLLDQCHIDVLIQTLRRSVAVKRRDLGAEWRGVRDGCPDCQEFKLTALKSETGVTAEMLADPVGYKIGEQYAKWLLDGDEAVWRTLAEPVGGTPGS